MTYCESILGKKISDLTIKDMEDFFQANREESLNLEFKSYPTKGDHKEKENAIKKTVCALLNSEGGVVIWGAPVEIILKDGIRSATGPLTPFKIEHDKDRLVNKLTSSIIPMPVGIKVKILTKDDNKSIIIIEVEKSLVRPHQYDNYYYVRLDGQSRIAPHYLIKALMLGKEFPIIKGHVRLKSIDEDRGNVYLNFRLVILNSTEFINEKNLNYRLMVSHGKIIIGANQYNIYDHKTPILSKGGPQLLNFRIHINISELPCNLSIILHFGGEKSPFKSSSYDFRFDTSFDAGTVNDEIRYLFEKKENKLSTDISDATDEDIIERIFALS